MLLVGSVSIVLTAALLIIIFFNIYRMVSRLAISPL